MVEKQKKVLVRRIQLVDVVLERKGSQLFPGRRVRSPEDAAKSFDISSEIMTEDVP